MMQPRRQLKAAKLTGLWSCKLTHFHLNSARRCFSPKFIVGFFVRVSNDILVCTKRRAVEAPSICVSSDSCLFSNGRRGRTSFSSGTEVSTTSVKLSLTAEGFGFQSSLFETGAKYQSKTKTCMFISQATRANQFRSTCVCTCCFSVSGPEDLGLRSTVFRAAVNPEGFVTWVLSKRFSTKCTVDLTLMPFDSQTCEIQMIAGMMSGFGQHPLVKFLLASDEIIREFYTSDVGWNLHQAQVRKNKNQALVFFVFISFSSKSDAVLFWKTSPYFAEF